MSLFLATIQPGTSAAGEHFASVWLIAISVGLFMYVLPTFIAFSRNKSNKVPILVLNLLLGWTLIGWVASLVWSLTKDEHRSIVLGQTFQPSIETPEREHRGGRFEA